MTGYARQGRPRLAFDPAFVSRRSAHAMPPAGCTLDLDSAPNVDSALCVSPSKLGVDPAVGVDSAKLRLARTRLFTPALLLVLSGCGGALSEARDSEPASSRIAAVELGDAPEEVRDDYQVFARRCTRCHSLSRSLTTTIREPRHWDLYIEKMRRIPGAGIPKSDVPALRRFVRYYSAKLRPRIARAKQRPGGIEPAWSASRATASRATASRATLAQRAPACRPALESATRPAPLAARSLP